VCVCCACVSSLLISSKMILYLRCLFSPHQVNLVVSRRLTHKSVCTSPTRLKNLSGDTEVAGTTRYCLVIRSSSKIIRDIFCVQDHRILHSCFNIPNLFPYKSSTRFPTCGVLTHTFCTRGLRLLTHRFPTRIIRGSPDFVTCVTLSRKRIPKKVIL
jgi:hypothetical protein